MDTRFLELHGLFRLFMFVRWFAGQFLKVEYKRLFDVVGVGVSLVLLVLV